MITQFQILNNIGLYNNYENQVDFNDKLSQDTFWGSKVIKYYDNTKLNFLNDNIIILTANFNEANKWSYARAFVTDDITHQSKLHYYFINSVKVRGTYDPTSKEQIIELELEEDVIQTYMFDYELKESFIEREHQDRWLNSEGSYTPLFNIVKENLDLGEEYVINEKNIPFTTDGISILGNTIKVAFLLVCMSDPIPASDVSPSIDRLFYYAIPFVSNYSNTGLSFTAGTYNLISVDEFLNYANNEGGVADRVLGMYYIKSPNLKIDSVTLLGNVGTGFKIKLNFEGTPPLSFLNDNNYWNNKNVLNPLFEELTDIDRKSVV